MIKGNCPNCFEEFNLAYIDTGLEECLRHSCLTCALDIMTENGRSVSFADFILVNEVDDRDGTVTNIYRS